MRVNGECTWHLFQLTLGHIPVALWLRSKDNPKAEAGDWRSKVSRVWSSPSQSVVDSLRLDVGVLEQTIDIHTVCWEPSGPHRSFAYTIRVHVHRRDCFSHTF